MVTICSETRQLKDTVLNLQAATGVTDQSNYGNDGTFFGDVGSNSNSTEFVFLDIEDEDRIEVTIPALTSDGTLSVWVKFDSLLAGTHYILSTYGNSGFLLNQIGDDLYVYWGSQSTTYTHADVFVTDVWYHVCVTNISGTLQLYINGEPSGSTYPEDGTATGTALEIGGSDTFPARNIHGSVRDIRIATRGYTLTEIRLLYNATARPDITGTVLHLRPETGLVDQSGTQDPASFNGNAAVEGRRFIFDGTGDYINIAADSSLRPTAQITVSAWVQATDGNDAVYRTIISGKEASGDGWLMDTIPTTGFVRWIQYLTTVGARTTTSTINVRDGGLYHIVGTYDSVNGSKLYINGVEDATAANGGAITYATPADVTIGTQTGGYYWQGSIHSSLRVIPSELTAAQVLSLYEGVPGYEPPLPVRQIPDTVLHLEAASGERDLSNHGNYGTFTGTDVAANSTDTEFVFNGTDDSLLLGKLWNPPAMTVSLWFRGTDAALNEDLIGDTPGYFAIKQSTSGKINARIYDGANKTAPGTSDTLDGEWHHAVATWNGTTARIYVDGIQEGSVAAGAMPAAGATVEVEVAGGSFAGFKTMDADDVRMFTRELSASEISLLYNKGVRGYRPVGLLGGEVLALHPSRHDVGVLPDTVLQLDGKTGVTDQSPMGNDGTYAGGMAVVDGKFELDGSTNWITTPLDTGAFSEITISLWVNLDSLSAWNVFAGRTDSSSWNDGWALSMDGSGNLLFWVDNYATPATIAFSTTSSWVHLCGTYDGTNQKLYINGVLQSTVADVWSNHAATGELTYIGTYQASAGAAIDGQSDDIRILDRALSATEVLSLYNNDISDESGNGNNGTQTNGAYVGEDDEIVFDGVDDYVDTPDNSSSLGGGPLSFNDIEDWTVSVWYKGTDTEQNGDWGKAILGRDNGDLYAQFILRSGYCEYLHYNGGWQHNIKSTTLVADGEWHLLTYVNHSDETGDLYIDGVNEIDGLSSTIDAATRRFVISNFMRGYNGKYTSGSLRDTRVFNRALTAAEVAFLASEYEVEVPNTKGSALSIVPSYDDWGNATLNAMDFSGNGNVGTLTNMTTGDWTADTDSGGTRAIEYDGTDDYTEVLSSASLNSPTTSLTVSVWVKPSSTDDGIFLLKFNTSPPSGGGDYWFDITSSKFSAKSYGATGIVNALAVFSPDTWYNLTLVWISGVSLRFYIDGVLQGTDVSPGSITSAAFPLWIARWNADHLDGLVDDTYVWDRALSLDEIKALASTRNYFDCPVVSAIIQTRRRRLSLSGGML